MIVPLVIWPLLLTTIGYDFPAVSDASPGGTTNKMLWLLTDLRPHAAPLILKETPLSSIGKLKLRDKEPTAVRGVTAGVKAVEKST